MPKTRIDKLDPAQVVQCAAKIGCRQLFVEDPNVLSFLLGHPPKAGGDEKDKAALARVNVYIDTGTVGTCRVLQGQVREVFRRNITIDGLRKILLNPADSFTVIEDTFSTESVDNKSGDTASKQISAKMELAEVGLAILIGEKQRLEAHLEHLRQENSHSDDSSDEKDLSGMDFEFGFEEEVLEQVDQCLKDIADMEKQVTCVATNGKSAIFLYGHGGLAITPAIPKALHHKVNELKRPNRGTTRPSYVALGTRERYYVSFHDGTYDFKGPKQLGTLLKQQAPQETPRSVAFGSTFDTFFIVFHDGSWEYHGRGIPNDMREKLAAREERPDLTCVTLGPKGEWFIRAQNGRMWWGGITDQLDSVIQDLLESDQFLSFMDFGDNDSYFICYD